jgi:hypothetical protein
MKHNLGWGVAVGTVVAIVAWLGDSRPNVVSLFPDLLSLIVFVALAAIVLGRSLREFKQWRQAVGSMLVFGASAGLILAISTLLRGSERWGSTEVGLAAATVVGSVLIILLLSCSVGLLTVLARHALVRG